MPLLLVSLRQLLSPRERECYAVSWMGGRAPAPNWP